MIILINMSNLLIRNIIMIFLLIWPVVATDIPFVFDGKSSGVAGYTAEQLEDVSKSSPDLAGLPSLYTPSSNETITIPITGGGEVREGETEVNVGDIAKALDNKVEPGNPTIRRLALSLAAKHSGDHTVDQICEIYSYLKYGNGTKRKWSYVPDPRGINDFNFASYSLTAGTEAGCVGAGDCDDFAILMASLVESIGGATRIILVDNTSIGGHAYSEVYLGRLNTPGNHVEDIIKWIRWKYDTDKIFAHIDTNTSEVWLNLDWGRDDRGNAHPGGPFFPGDKHIVLCIRTIYVKIPQKVPESANSPPKLISLAADKISPQEAGEVITWTTKATDKDRDQILYRFFLDGEPATKWTKDNIWVWTSSDNDEGENQIEVQIRDGNHAGPDGSDSSKVDNFMILESTSMAVSQFRSEETPPNQSPENKEESKENDSKLWIKKANALSDAGRYEESLQTYDQAIKIDPKDAEAWNDKGVALNKLVRHKEALDAYEKAIAIDSHYAEAWNNKGIVLCMQGKYNEALQSIDKAISINSKLAEAWYAKGLALDYLGQSTQAEANFIKAKELGYKEDLYSISSVKNHE
jgi:tetratricopeptide (TPR) repeat protein